MTLKHAGGRFGSTLTNKESNFHRTVDLDVMKSQLLVEIEVNRARRKEKEGESRRQLATSARDVTLSHEM